MAKKLTRAERSAANKAAWAAKSAAAKKSSWAARPDAPKAVLLNKPRKAVAAKGSSGSSKIEKRAAREAEKRAKHFADLNEYALRALDTAARLGPCEAMDRYEDVLRDGIRDMKPENSRENAVIQNAKYARSKFQNAVEC